MKQPHIGIRLEEKKAPPKDYRRKHKRYIVQSGYIVVLQIPRLINIVQPKKIELGPIVNISNGGLMTQFIENKLRCQRCDRMDICRLDGSGIIRDIPFEVVAEFAVAKMPDGNTILNRSIKFLELTDMQTFQLKEFMDNNTAGHQADRRSGRERRRHLDPDYENEEWQIKEDRRSGLDRRKFPAMENANR